MGYRVGIDSGGAFTDLQAIGGDGRVEIVKVPSTPLSPDRGFRHILELGCQTVPGDRAAIVEQYDSTVLILCPDRGRKSTRWATS